MAYDRIKSHCYVSLGTTCLRLHVVGLVTDRILGDKEALKVLEYHATVVANSDEVPGDLKRRFKSSFAPLKLGGSMMVSWKRTSSPKRGITGSICRSTAPCN